MVVKLAGECIGFLTSNRVSLNAEVSILIGLMNS